MSTVHKAALKRIKKATVALAVMHEQKRPRPATHGNSGGPVFSWETGRVFGVLQSSVNDQYDQFLFSRAESVYRLLDEDSVEHLLAKPRPQDF